MSPRKDECERCRRHTDWPVYDAITQDGDIYGVMCRNCYEYVQEPRIIRHTGRARPARLVRFRRRVAE